VPAFARRLPPSRGSGAACAGPIWRGRRAASPGVCRFVKEDSNINALDCLTVDKGVFEYQRVSSVCLTGAPVLPTKAVAVAFRVSDTRMLQRAHQRLARDLSTPPRARFSTQNSAPPKMLFDVAWLHVASYYSTKGPCEIAVGPAIGAFSQRSATGEAGDAVELSHRCLQARQPKQARLITKLGKSKPIPFWRATCGAKAPELL
jgi:hypothetical protein